MLNQVVSKTLTRPAIKARMREEERRAAAAPDAGRETAQVGGDRCGLA